MQGPLLRRILTAEPGSRTVVLGGAHIPTDRLRDSSVCYCAGVGEDIALELGLIDLFGCRVWSFDPTPRSIEFISRINPDPQRFTFVPVGLWGSDSVLTFHAPEDPSHVSHSVEGPLGGSSSFTAPCRRVPTIMAQLGHDHLDLLKMNIEGAEDRVLADIVTAGVHPSIIAVTFEGSRAFSKAIRWTRRLQGLGYVLVGVNGWFYTFARPPGS